MTEREIGGPKTEDENNITCIANTHHNFTVFISFVNCLWGTEVVMVCSILGP